MKNFGGRWVLVLILVLGVGWWLLTPPQTAEQQQQVQALAAKKGAKQFSNQQFKKGKIPYNTGITLTGKIVQTDAADRQNIGREDRIVVLQKGNRYQVLIACDVHLQLGEMVTVYGTFMGLTRADWIEKG